MPYFSFPLQMYLSLFVFFKRYHNLSFFGVCYKCPFLWLSGIPLSADITSSLSVGLSMGIRDCYHVLAICIMLL